MSPFIADTFNRPTTTPTEHVPDLSQPSVAGLAYMLRHDETWPSTFGPWDFALPQRCAMGLCLHKWGEHPTQVRSLGPAVVRGVFGTIYWLAQGRAPSSVTPKDVADALLDNS